MRRFLFAELFFLAVPFLWIPQVHADIRNEFNQQQTQEQEANSERQKLCDFLLARSQFKTVNQSPIYHFYIDGNTIVRIEGSSEFTRIENYCRIWNYGEIGVPKKVYNSLGLLTAIETLYIEEGALVYYSKNAYKNGSYNGKIHRGVIAPPRKPE